MTTKQTIEQFLQDRVHLRDAADLAITAFVRDAVAPEAQTLEQAQEVFGQHEVLRQTVRGAMDVPAILDLLDKNEEFTDARIAEVRTAALTLVAAQFDAYVATKKELREARAAGTVMTSEEQRAHDEANRPPMPAGLEELFASLQ